ncbi:MAG: hypothetical protein ACLRZ9_04540 [Eubacterium sp.]
MRKKLFKKITATVLSLSMIVGMTGVVSAAHAANGANVAAGKSWTSYSVCTMEDHVSGEDGSTAHPWCWYHALTHLQTDAYPNGQVYGEHFATEGWVTTDYSVGELTSATVNGGFRYFVKNSGWDGNYDPNGNLVADNPWGLTATLTGVPVELGRYYTVSFKIKSTLKGTKTLKDDKGEDLKDENGNTVTEPVTKKHILFKTYDPGSPGEPGVEFITVSGGTTAGYLELDSASDTWKTVTATIKIPEKNYGGSILGVKFALGANMVTYPDELGMKGDIYVKDFKITAGTQYTVKLTDPVSKKSITKYVNQGGTTSSYAFTRKGYTLAGYKNAATGATYNFSTPVNSNLNLTAVWVKTAKPAKPAIKKVKSGKKKVTVTLKKKVKNAVGYQIQYSTKKSMKGKKTKLTTKTKYTIKKLKSGSNVYVKVRAYTLDSTGSKVYGKLSARKKAYVK